MITAKEHYHSAVVNALTKENWAITANPFDLEQGRTSYGLDWSEEKVIGAKKNDTQIAITVEEFLTSSPVSEFHLAMGRYMNYRMILDSTDPACLLYLAAPADTYSSFFVGQFPQAVVRQHKLKLLFYDPKCEVVTQWVS